MGLMTDIGIKRKLNRLDELSGDEAVALRAELCGIAGRERDKAIKKGSRYSFCLYSTLLGDLYLQTDDQSDAIRPYGLAYLTACAMGERCDAERLQAVEGLATSNILVGEFVFALDLILEAIEGAARRPTRFEVSDLVVVLTDAAMNEGNRREVRSFYDDLREGLWERRHEGWAAPAIALLDHTFAAPGERPGYSAFRASVASARHPAAELLLPADQIAEELPTTTDWTRLAELKVRWGVSMTALLRRARALGVLNDSAYVQALKTMSTRGWNRREPVRLPSSERPVLLARALELASQQGATLATLGDEIGLPVDWITRIIGSLDDPRPQVSV